MTCRGKLAPFTVELALTLSRTQRSKVGKQKGAEEAQVQVLTRHPEGASTQPQWVLAAKSWGPLPPLQDKSNMSAASLPPSKSGAGFPLRPALTWNHAGRRILRNVIPPQPS